MTAGNEKVNAPAGDSDRLARFIAGELTEMKGEDVVVLRMSEVLPVTDYFVIATGRSARHVDALVDQVYRKLKGQGVLPLSRSGGERKWWVLLDYGDVVIHVFQRAARTFYDLELLWADAEKVPYGGGTHT